MACWMERVEPPPISTIAITAAMPMIMPKQVSAERITLRRSARKAIRNISLKLPILSVRSAPNDFRQKRILLVRRRRNDFAGDDFIAFAQTVRDDGRVRAIGNARGHFNGPDVFA